MPCSDSGGRPTPPPGVTDTADDLRRTLTDSPARFLLAEADGQVVGSIIGTFDGWRGNIYWLVVHPGYRRRRIARRLMAEIEKRLVNRGAKMIMALVEKDYPWAGGFWQAVGYPVDHRIDGLFVTWNDYCVNFMPCPVQA